MAQRPTSKNLNPKYADQAPKTRKLIRGLPAATLMGNTPAKAIERSRQVRVVKRFSGTTGTGVVTLRFEMKSKNPTTSHIPPVHDCLIKLVGPNRYWVSCGCEDFCYRWEYALEQHGASSQIHGNGEPAVITNPSNKPGVCLHVYKALSLASTYTRLEQVQQSKVAKQAARSRGG